MKKKKIEFIKICLSFFVSHGYKNNLNDDEPVEQYLQVDPRCYVRQSMNTHRRGLEKGHSINVDTRPSGTSSSSLSPYRQSSFDVTHYSPDRTISSMTSQQEMFFTPRGSSLSVVAHFSTGTPPGGSQHLSPPISFTSRQNSITEKKDLHRTSEIVEKTSTIVLREHEHSRSLEHSNVSNNYSIDKQSRSFDTVHLLRPDDRRTNSDDCPTPIAPLPIVIKIPDMRELVQTVQYSHYQTVDDQQQQLGGTSVDEFSLDLLTSTSIDSAGAMVNDQNSSMKINDDDRSKYEYRRKSSSNLLLPPAEVRRQALRRTFEKRRRCLNQSNDKHHEQFFNNPVLFDDDSEQQINSLANIRSTDFSSLFNNFNTKSENSSFDRSLETDFDVQSDASSRGPTDQFTSIESSGNENTLPDRTHRLIIDPQQEQHDDSGFKSIESQNQTISLDWTSAETEINPSPLLHPYSNQQFKFSPHLSLDKSTGINLSPSIEQHDGSLKKKLANSTSFIRTASKKRREFGKDKRYATSNVVIPHSNIQDDYLRFPSVDFCPYLIKRFPISIR